MKFRIKTTNKLGGSENSIEVEVQEISKTEIEEVVKLAYSAIHKTAIN